jgi:hypothetical protein
LQREILFQHDLEEILGKRPYDTVKEEEAVVVESAQTAAEDANPEKSEEAPNTEA